MRKGSLCLSAILLAIFSTTLILFTGCQKELSGSITNNLPDIDKETVNAGVRGIVLDENNQPVMGATVSSGTNNTTTDRYGVFSFKNITLSKANGWVKVNRNGYYTAFRSFATTASRIHNVRIRLLPKIVVGNFSGSTGGTISISGGGKLMMPAAAVIDAGGNAYTGTVNVAMTWIDPSSTNLPEIVQGDLRGITTGGEERGLETFGMLGVELTGTGGQILNIANGKTAELTFPIPASIIANAPTTIELWNFDEATARWRQEGQATKNGSNYVAQVSHFSFWNCDAPFPLINLCMTLVNASNSQPLNNVQVRIKRPNGSYGSGWTDSLGNLCGKVPQNEALVLQVMDQCNNVVFTQNIGPFSSNATLGTISVTIPTTQSLTITGTLVNCTNGNVTNGAAVIYTSNSYSYSVPVTNGTFSFTILRCSSTTINFSVLGVDYSTLQQGTPVSGSGTSGTVNLGSIQACGTSSSQFIEYLVDGSPSVFTVPPDNINTSDSSSTGTYSNNTNVVSIRTNSGGGTTTTNYSSFNFSNNLAPGTYPLNSCVVGEGNGNVPQQIITVNPVVNISIFGPPVTGFIEGNFNIQMNFSGTPKNVICNFRVRRN